MEALVSDYFIRGIATFYFFVTPEHQIALLADPKSTSYLYNFSSRLNSSLEPED